MKDADKLPDGPEKDNKRKEAFFLRKAIEGNSLRTLSMTGGKAFPYNYALGAAELANGHLIKGIGYFLKKIRVPKLPKEEK